jgi:hypothetical protein
MQQTNRTDQVAQDFFHSKTFKIILIVWGSLFGIAAIIVCCIVGVFSLGFGKILIDLSNLFISSPTPIP